MLKRIAIILASTCLVSQAYAASSTLGNLSAGSAISAADLFYDVQSVGSGGVKVTGTQMGVWTQSYALAHTGTWTAAQTFTNSDLILLGSSTGFTTFTSANAGASNFTATIPANTGTLSEINLAQTWTAAQTFTNSDILLLGSSTGATTFTSANAGASNFTLTFPAATDTLTGKATTDTLTNKTITSSTDSLGGVTAAFGSDAKGDIYTNGGSSNVVTRLGIGSTNQILTVASSLPAWTSNLTVPGTLTTNGAIISAVRSASTTTVTANATTDYFLCLDPTSNAINVALPATPATGLTYLIKDCTGQAATHTITVTPNSGNIDGSGTTTLTTNFQSIGITYTGSQWSIN